MRRHIFICSVAVLMATPAMAAPWVRGFAVQNYEPAFHFGGKQSSTDPGPDCPKGANPNNDYKQILKTAWRSDAEVAELTRPPSETGKEPVDVMGNALAHRGFRKDVETYINPFAAPDPGMQQVTGKIAEGFDLDGNAKTGGFTSPGGERGIDNAYYRVFGCALSFRGVAYHGYLSNRGNDKMLDGLYTVVIRISGNKDPLNDDAATVEIGYSPDHVVKDPNGNVVNDYSYRIATMAQYTKLKAKVKDGVVETVVSDDIRMPAFAWYETNRGEVVLHKGRIRFRVNADGNAEGLIGGYRDWRDIYGKDTFNVPSGGQSRETTYYQNQIAFYYALKRNADGLADPKTGQNMGISTAYRFSARPAYVVDPQTPVAIDEPSPSNFADIERDLFIKAVNTKSISAEPRRRRGPAAVKPDVEPPAAAPQPGKPGLQVENGLHAPAVASAAR